MLVAAQIVARSGHREHGPHPAHIVVVGPVGEALGLADVRDDGDRLLGGGLIEGRVSAWFIGHPVGHRRDVTAFASGCTAITTESKCLLVWLFLRITVTSEPSLQSLKNPIIKLQAGVNCSVGTPTRLSSLAIQRDSQLFLTEEDQYWTTWLRIGL